MFPVLEKTTFPILRINGVAKESLHLAKSLDVDQATSSQNTRDLQRTVPLLAVTADSIAVGNHHMLIGISTDISEYLRIDRVFQKEDATGLQIGLTQTCDYVFPI